MAIIKMTTDDMIKLTQDLENVAKNIEIDKASINSIFDQLVSSFPQESNIEDMSDMVQSELKHIDDLCKLLNRISHHLQAVLEGYVNTELKMTQNIMNSFED